MGKFLSASRPAGYGLFTKLVHNFPQQESDSGTGVRWRFANCGELTMKRFLGLAATVFLAAFAGAAQAATTSGTPFTVQVTVTAGCNINSGPTGTIDFGSAAGTGAAPADVASAVNVTCTSGTTYDIYFVSANSTGTTSRLMTNGGTADTVGYQILSGATPIGDSTALATISGTGTGAAQNYPISFHINAWGPVEPLTYTDTVTLTVEF